MSFINYNYNNLSWTINKNSKIKNIIQEIIDSSNKISEFFNNNELFYKIDENIVLIKINALKQDSRLSLIYRDWNQETINNSAIIYYFYNKYAVYIGIVLNNLSNEHLSKIKKSSIYHSTTNINNESLNYSQANKIYPLILPFYLSSNNKLLSAQEIIIEENLI